MFWRRKATTEKSAVRTSALEEIARTWSVDEADVTPHEHGFNWLPGSHVVRVRIHEDDRKPIGATRFRITITTDYRRSVAVHDMTFVLQASLVANSLSPTYSPVYPPGELARKYFKDHPTDMHLFSSAYVYDETVKWTSGFLARMSIMQPINAESHSRGVSPIKSGTPALATGSVRPTVNGVLNIHKDLLIPEGKKASRWIGSEEFETYIQEYGRNDVCFGFANDRGMSFETPFGSDSALVQFNTDEGDVQLGHGLVVRTQIRVAPSEKESEQAPDDFSFDWACGLAENLNYFESVQWTDFPQLGRWHPFAISEDQWSLAHTCFIPNAYFNEGIVLNFALWAIARARWARQWLLPQEKDLTMIEILENRFGPLSERS